MNSFIDQHKDNWQRLEQLLAMLRGSSLRGLSRAEVREFGELYRRAASDLAIARAETRDPKLINYLNSLVIRAHGKIYRARGEGAGMIWKFFSKDLPQTFRSNINYMAAAFAIFTGSLIFGLIATYLDTDFTHFVMLSGITDEIKSNNYWWLRLNDGNQIGASAILTNNILVTFRAFAMGALFGVGAVYDLAFFGAHVGSLFGACLAVNPPFTAQIGAFIIGHGVIEISTVLFCGGAGMMIGYAMIDPGDLSRSQALKKKGFEAARIVIGSACLLFIAGIIEGFVSPAQIPPVIKYATGISTGILMYSYLFLAGREDPTGEAVTTPAQQ